MARYLPFIYNFKNVTTPCDTKGNKNGKKCDEPKSEDKDNNNTDTVGAHVGESVTPQDSRAPSDRSSICTHVFKVEEPNVWPTQSVQDMLATHAINDPIRDCTDACDVSIDTVNSAEA